MLDEVKLVKKGKLLAEYNDMVDWLMMLYENPRLKVPEDNIRIIFNAYTQTQKISSMIEQTEISLKNQRTEIENKLQKDKKEFVDTLEEVK